MYASLRMIYTVIEPQNIYTSLRMTYTVIGPQNIYTSLRMVYTVIEPCKVYTSLRMTPPILVLLFSKFNKIFFGYFDPENITLDNKNK